jgi:hypothetical protein
MALSSWCLGEFFGPIKLVLLTLLGLFDAVNVFASTLLSLSSLFRRNILTPGRCTLKVRC